MKGAELFEKINFAVAKRRQSFKGALPEVFRLFHGETEGFSPLSLEIFKDLLWATWKVENGYPLEKLQWLAGDLAEEIEIHKESLGFPALASLLNVFRPARGEVPKDVELGRAWDQKFSFEPFWVNEFGVDYQIHCKDVKHPGLFLDHAPVRKKLIQANGRYERVLNLFCYTGSLGIAAAKGGAREVVQVDLSKPILDWAKQNEARLSEKSSPEQVFTFRYIKENALEYLERLVKRKEHFDLVLCDPPSFSRFKSGTFSVESDLVKLHSLLVQVTSPGGTIMSSINTAKYEARRMKADILAAALKVKQRVEIQAAISAPEATFPNATHLKGFWINRLS